MGASFDQDSLARLRGLLWLEAVVWQFGLCPLTGDEKKIHAIITGVNHDCVHVLHPLIGGEVSIAYDDVRAVVLPEHDQSSLWQVQSYRYLHPQALGG